MLSRRHNATVLRSFSCPTYVWEIMEGVSRVNCFCRILLPHLEMLPKTQQLGRVSKNFVSYLATADESRPEQGV